MKRVNIDKNSSRNRINPNTCSGGAVFLKRCGFRPAFTLIELLVVVAIIGLLMSILVPGLRVAKLKASGVVCVTRQKNLVLAWKMYAEDNRGNLVSSDTKGTQDSWAQWPQLPDGARVQFGSADFTIEARKRGIEKGALFPYIKSIDFYHCPGDRRILVEPETAKECAFRTYSLPSGLNSGWASANNTNGLIISDYICHTKMSTIRNAGNTLCFVEESENTVGYNQNGWAFYMKQARFYDPLAVNHKDASTLSFADGHAILRKWEDKVTIDLFQSGKKDQSVDPTNADYLFLRNINPFEHLRR